MRAKKEKLTVGQKVGRLEVKELINSFTGKGIPRIMAICECDCGNKKTLRADGLTSGNTRSCGCLNQEKRKETITRRNEASAKFGSFSAEHPETFQSWRSMLHRCYYPSQKAYKDYGGKGVKVCEYLRESPHNLVTLIGHRTKGNPSLDRFPNHSGHYSCGVCSECLQEGWQINVRWTTRKGQALNRGDFNVHLTAFGKTMTKSQWMEASGLSWSCLTGRIRRGWTIEKSLSTPDGDGNCYKST